MSLKPVNHTKPEIRPLDESDLADPWPQNAADLDSSDEVEPVDSDSETGRPMRAPTTDALVKMLPLGLSVVTLLYLFHLGGQVNSLRQGSKGMMVQMINGRSIMAEPVDNYTRSPVTVEQTVELWANLSFNWNQTLPNGKPDRGKVIGGKQFPTPLTYGSSLMSYEIQQIWYEVFLKRDDYLPRNFLGSKTTRSFIPKLQTTPRPPIDPRTGQPIPNRYEVAVHGDWIEYSIDAPQGRRIERMHWLLRLRPVVKTEKPLNEAADSLQQAAYELRGNGLEIYDIQRIEHVY